MKTVLAWLIGVVVVIVVGARLAIAVLGGGELASEDPTILLDALIMAFVVLVALYFGIQAAVYSPWFRLTERIRADTPMATVLSSAIETDQFSFFHSNGFPHSVGPWPFHAAIALQRNSLVVWRRIGGQDKKVAEVNSGDLVMMVVLVHSPIGVFPALEVANARGSLRLYPMQVSRWSGAKRLSMKELEDLVSAISAP